MRNSRLSVTDDTGLMVVLAVGLAVCAACSSGSGDGAAGGSSTAGAGGSTAGTGGSTVGTGGSTTGTGGSTTGTGGSTTGTGGSTTGTGGAAGTTGPAVIAQDSVCYNATKVLDPVLDRFVDDFENTEAGVLPGWYAFNDLAGAPNSVKPGIEPGGATTTANSLHYQAAGILAPAKGGYGAGLTWGMVAFPTYSCVDLTQFTGVSFWAKLGSTATANKQIRFKVSTPDTNAKATEAGKFGGDCVTKADGSGCYNPPNKLITLTADWVQYAVKFTDLTGGTLPTGKMAAFNGLGQELVWTSDGPDFDFSLDEITLFSGTAPTGPVAP
jgi:hypothetical protein